MSAQILPVQPDQPNKEVNSFEVEFQNPEIGFTNADAVLTSIRNTILSGPISPDQLQQFLAISEAINNYPFKKRYYKDEINFIQIGNMMLNLTRIRSYLLVSIESLDITRKMLGQISKAIFKVSQVWVKLDEASLIVKAMKEENPDYNDISKIVLDIAIAFI